MDLFNKGQHAFNKKYERFSDAYRLANKYKKKTRIYRSKDPGDGADVFFIPSRKEKFGKRRTGRWEKIWSVYPLKYLTVLFSSFSERMRRIRENRASALLGYIPSKLFIGLCVITCGLYPYVWVWGNTYAFNAVGGRIINENSVKRFAILGFTVQLMFIASAAARIVWMASGAGLANDVFQTAALAFVSLYFLIVFPMRCYNYFCIRWALRSAVIEWDSEGVMVGRSMTSWFKLFLLGSVYIQRHINRLMGLGMPGFADSSEIEPDATLSEIIDNYVTTGRPDRVSVSWTKDNYEPGVSEEYDEEYDG